jgi:hypothetical protein
MAYFNQIEVSFKDSPNLDAFSRLRASNPVTLFDAQMTYDLNPLLFEQVTNGSGATITHDATNRCALMTFSSTATGGKAYLQSYEYIRYQPSKSQLVFMTYNFIEHKANTLKFTGLGDANNGLFLESNGTGFQFKIYSDTTNGDQTELQANWNLDKLDGTGASGLTLAVDKTNILIIDFQALYAGRVRFGFDIGGQVVYAHEFTHANEVAYPYIQSANLPVKAGMTCTGTVSTTMNHICCAVVSEGGTDETVGYEFSQEGTATAGSGVRTHLLSVRPKTTFNSITNHSKIGVIEVDVLVTGNNPVLWELCIGQAISGTTTYNDINNTYSSMEYNTAGSLAGNPSVVIDSGYVSASNQTKGTTSMTLTQRYPITLDSSGAVRNLGTLTLLVTGIGNSSACRGLIKFREIR